MAASRQTCQGDFDSTFVLGVLHLKNMNAFSHLPPGFGFFPTEEQLVHYYLPKRIAAEEIDLDVIKDVDLYKVEPWDLTGVNDENERYFFSQNDKKYQTGTRTNRATKAGFWKATGRDKAIYSKHSLVGMRKTLVFYKGRAPNGLKSDWIMHEYRLETSENDATQEERWVVCRVFKKPTPTMPTMRKTGDYESPCWNRTNQDSFTSKLDSSSQISHLYTSSFHHHNQCNPELKLPCNLPPKSLLQLSQQDCPKLPHGFGRNNGCSLKSSTTTHEEQMDNQNHRRNLNSFYEQKADQMTGWKLVDEYVASQLSNDQDSLKQHNLQAFHEPEFINIHDPKSKWLGNSDESAWTSGSSRQINLWK